MPSKKYYSCTQNLYVQFLQRTHFKATSPEKPLDEEELEDSPAEEQETSTGAGSVESSSVLVSEEEDSWRVSIGSGPELESSPQANSPRSANRSAVNLIFSFFIFTLKIHS